MPALLRHIFGYGFHDPPGGIRKRVDLRTKLPVNTDMPWWSLPETMRAALYTWRIATEEDDRAEALRIFAKCWNAFTRNYVRPDRNLMAIQTLGGDGQPAQAIPATPDLDPGYHTGLSLIDCLKVMEEME